MSTRLVTFLNVAIHELRATLLGYEPHLPRWKTMSEGPEGSDITAYGKLQLVRVADDQQLLADIERLLAEAEHCEAADGPAEKRRFKLVLEDTETGRVTEFGFDSAHLSQDQGYDVVSHPGAMMVDYRHNGHERLELKAWSGFDQWEDFRGGDR